MAAITGPVDCVIAALFIAMLCRLNLIPIFYQTDFQQGLSQKNACSKKSDKKFYYRLSTFFKTRKKVDKLFLIELSHFFESQKKVDRLSSGQDR